MLKHGRAGVPMEVMGLMLGEFVDDYTVRLPPLLSLFSLPWTPRLSRDADPADLLRRRLCHASSRYDSHSRIGRPRLPDENAGYAQTDRKTRNGCWMVSFSSRIRVLVE